MQNPVWACSNIMSLLQMTKHKPSPQNHSGFMASPRPRHAQELRRGKGDWGLSGPRRGGGAPHQQQHWQCSTGQPQKKHSHIDQQPCHTTRHQYQSDPEEESGDDQDEDEDGDDMTLRPLMHVQATHQGLE